MAGRRVRAVTVAEGGVAERSLERRAECSSQGPEVVKPKKGRNFTTEEERLLCRSFLHISQDPCVGSGQKKEAFWERITTHFNENCVTGSRPARSLESKWHVIKHDVSKFCGCYAQVERLNASGQSNDDILERALDLYKLKAPKNQSFLFLHCWWVLKDVPRWAEGPAKQMTSSKRKDSTSDADSDCVEMDVPQSGVAQEPVGSIGVGRRLKRPVGSRIAKEENKSQKLRELAIRAQAAATKDMAAATWRKTELLADQNVLMLFTTPDIQITDPGALEYLRLRREEELSKLRRRLEEEAAAEAKRKAAAVKGSAPADNVGSPQPTRERGTGQQGAAITFSSDGELGEGSDDDLEAGAESEPGSPEDASQTAGAASQTAGASSQHLAAGSQPVPAGSQPIAAGSQRTVASSHTVLAGSQATVATSQPAAAASPSTAATSQTAPAWLKSAAAWLQTATATPQCTGAAPEHASGRSRRPHVTALGDAPVKRSLPFPAPVSSANRRKFETQMQWSGVPHQAWYTPNINMGYQDSQSDSQREF